MWPDLAYFVKYVTTFNTSPTFTCSVTGQTALIAAAGTDGASTVTFTVNLAGMVTAMSEHLVRTGLDQTYTGTTDYTTPPTVAAPSSTISQSGWSHAVDRGMRSALSTQIVKAAKAKVKAKPTAAKRISVLRSISAAQAKLFLPRYQTGSDVVIKRVSIARGVKITVTYKGAIAWAKIQVKGNQVVTTYGG